MDSEADTWLKPVFIRPAIDLSAFSEGLHAKTQRQLEGIQTIVWESYGAVRMMVEEETYTYIISVRDGVPCLGPKGDMGIERGRDDNVPRIRLGIKAIIEHQSYSEFAAVTKTETAKDQQRTIDIAVDAINVAHPRAVGCFDG